MAQSLLWKDVSRAQIEQLQRDSNDIGLLRHSLRSIMRLDEDVLSPAHAKILEDMYFYLLSFAYRLKLNAEKQSTLLSMFNAVHTQTIGKHLTMNQCLALFKELVSSHSIQRPPFSVNIFTMDEAQQIYDYFFETYLRHYKLYQATFAEKFVMDFEGITIGDSMQTMSVPKPLSEGTAKTLEEEQQEQEERERKEREEAAAAEEQTPVDSSEPVASKVEAEKEVSRAPPVVLTGDAITDTARQTVTSQFDQLKSILMDLVKEQNQQLMERLEKMESQTAPEVKKK